jgi:hypothetical protein
MVKSPTGLIAPLSRSHIRHSFLIIIDIVFHLPLRTAFFRLVSIPGIAKMPRPVDACGVCGYGSRLEEHTAKGRDLI